MSAYPLPGNPGTPRSLRKQKSTHHAIRGIGSEKAARFCLILSGASVEQAVTDLSQQARNTYPPSIEVEVEGWYQAIQPGDDPEALIQRFLGWAQEAMIEETAQSGRRRLIRSSARLEHIENTWQERKQRGQEKIYHSTMQANLFYRKWQQGIKAAERCVSLIRAQPTGACSDAQEPSPVPEPTRPAMRLPDWEPRPPEHN